MSKNTHNSVCGKNWSQIHAECRGAFGWLKMAYWRNEPSHGENCTEKKSDVKIHRLRTSHIAHSTKNCVYKFCFFILIWLLCVRFGSFGFLGFVHFVRLVFIHFIFIYFFVAFFFGSSFIFFIHFARFIRFYTVLLCIAAVDCLPCCCSLFSFGLRLWKANQKKKSHCIRSRQSAATCMQQMNELHGFWWWRFEKKISFYMLQCIAYYMLAFKMYNIWQQQQQKQELRKHLILFYQKTTPANEWQQRHLYYSTK